MRSPKKVPPSVFVMPSRMCVAAASPKLARENFQRGSRRLSGPYPPGDTPLSEPIFFEARASLLS